MNNKMNLRMLHGSCLKKIIVFSIVLIFIACLVICVTASTSDNGTPITASLFFKENKFLFTGFPMLFIGLIAWIYTGDDIKNGTVTSKIAGGTSRGRIFFTKVVILTLIIGLILMLFMLIPLLILNLLFGWGLEFDFADTILRFVMMFFPCMRISAFVCLILIVTKNAVITFLTGLMDLIVCGIILDPGMGNAFSTGYANIMALMNYDSYYIYSIKPQIGFVDYYLNRSVFYDSLFLKTLLFSLIITGMYLVAGYCYFCKDPFYQMKTDGIKTLR